MDLARADEGHGAQEVDDDSGEHGLLRLGVAGHGVVQEDHVGQREDEAGEDDDAEQDVARPRAAPPQADDERGAAEGAADGEPAQAGPGIEGVECEPHEQHIRAAQEEEDDGEPDAREELAAAVAGVVVGHRVGGDFGVASYRLFGDG